MFDVEKFITLVEARPALYNTKIKEYANRDLKSRCWWEIGENMYSNWSKMTKEEKCDKEREFIKKWKAIRDNFVKDLRQQRKAETGESIKKKRRYIYFQRLQFLQPLIGDYRDDSPDKEGGQHHSEVFRKAKVLKTNANRNSSSDDAEMRGKKEQFAISGTKSLTNVLLEMVDLQNEERRRDKFGNKAFLLSFLPVMDELPFDLVLEARYKITEMFKNICHENASRLASLSLSNLILEQTIASNETAVNQEKVNHKMSTRNHKII